MQDTEVKTTGNNWKLRSLVGGFKGPSKKKNDDSNPIDGLQKSQKQNPPSEFK